MKVVKFVFSTIKYILDPAWMDYFKGFRQVFYITFSFFPWWNGAKKIFVGIFWDFSFIFLKKSYFKSRNEAPWWWVGNEKPWQILAFDRTSFWRLSNKELLLYHAVCLCMFMNVLAFNIWLRQYYRYVFWLVVTHF